MKNILLPIFLVLLFTQVKASDTLTVRQVYNFSVGDTFDYVETTANYDYNLFSTNYSRVIITQKTLNTTQDTLTYNGNWVITNLDSIAVYQVDTFTNPAPQVSFFDTSSFWGWNSNRIATNNVDGGTYTYVTDSLGLTRTGNTMASTINSGYYTNTYDKRLIYFSDGHRRYGRPYSDYVGINDIANISNVKIYPNPNSDILHLSFTGVGQNNVKLIITDIVGQEVYSSSVSQSETTHDISKLSPGIYTWRIVDNENILKTGKFVRQQK